MSRLELGNYFGGATAGERAAKSLKTDLDGHDPSALIARFNRLLARIPYEDIHQYHRKKEDFDFHGFNFGEWFYRHSLLTYLTGANADVRAETHGHFGRSDLVVITPVHTWVIELKVTDKSEDAPSLAEAALRQALETGYANAYENPIVLGIVVDESKRAITEWRSWTAEPKPLS
jgi:hypothetical protein